MRFTIAGWRVDLYTLPWFRAKTSSVKLQISVTRERSLRVREIFFNCDRIRVGFYAIRLLAPFCEDCGGRGAKLRSFDEYLCDTCYAQEMSLFAAEACRLKSPAAKIWLDRAYLAMAEAQNTERKIIERN
jgi:hypothetical protein